MLKHETLYEKLVNLGEEQKVYYFQCQTKCENINTFMSSVKAITGQWHLI